MSNRRALTVGTPEQVETALGRLTRAHGVDELVVNTLTHDPADRLRSYALLSEIFRTPQATGGSGCSAVL